MQDQIILYNTLGWATMPVFSKAGPTPWPHEEKEPAVGKGWDKRKPDPLGCVEEFPAYEKAGAYGVILNPEDLIIDLDKRHFKDNVNPWKKLRDDLGIGKVDAPAVITGNGVHFYLKKPPELVLGAKIKGYSGLDIKAGAPGKGVYVIGPGSKHPSGRIYRFAEGSDLSQVPPVPAKILDFFMRPQPDSDLPDTFNGTEQDYDRYVAHIKNIEIPGLIGRSGDAQRFRVACIGRDYGLKPKDTLRALQTVYNPLCTPVWDERKLKICVKNAYKYASGTAGKEDPAHVFTETPAERWDSELDESRGWDVDNNGGIRKTLKNVVTYLYLRPELAGTVRYNQFTGDLEVVGRLPWHDNRGISKVWTDADAVLLKYHFAKTCKVEFSVNLIWEALHTAGMRFAYHPVRDYVRGLKWDGVNRIDTWLKDYCGADDNVYVATTGRKLLLGMVARVFRPGVKFDYCVILEGDQGIGKSTVCAILGGDWYGDVIIDPHSRDTIDALRGKWVIELSEMEVTRRSDAQALKAFISRTSDRARLAYARASLDFPRQCVFIGTINPDDMGYLVDHTGNRRFWPVKCGTKIDMDGLAVVRDQLFAEAYTAYQGKEKLFLDGDIIQFAEIEQRKRMAVDPWQDVIASYLENEGSDIEEITIAQVWEIVLGGQARNLSRADQCRIGRILTQLRWWKSRPMRGGSRQYVHRRPVEV